MLVNSVKGKIVFTVLVRAGQRALGVVRNVGQGRDVHQSRRQEVGRVHSRDWPYPLAPRHTVSNINNVNVNNKSTLNTNSKVNVNNVNNKSTVNTVNTVNVINVNNVNTVNNANTVKDKSIVLGKTKTI